MPFVTADDGVEIRYLDTGGDGPGGDLGEISALG
ncbi:Uncharacterised protein [Nocardia otitidiscaviarum]|uniref:Uncharacterized protein n=1 Tax=Nocardia otitidiscaviarum TaxID=1823 RepID=A0A378YA84_9NOCA|nr:Uncharacterised protein [Nocardia otitidiscaviarum]